MSNYEFIEELNRYMLEHYNMRISMDKRGQLSAYSVGHNYGYGSGINGTPVGKHGEEFQKEAYKFVNWAIQSERRRLGL